MAEIPQQSIEKVMAKKEIILRHLKKKGLTIQQMKTHKVACSMSFQLARNFGIKQVELRNILKQWQDEQQ